MKYLYTHLSRQDLISIWHYIAQDNEKAADRVLDNIKDKLGLLADNPRLGTLRKDIAEEMRTFPVGSYLIFYKEYDEGIVVIRIIHGARNLEALFVG